MQVVRRILRYGLLILKTHCTFQHNNYPPRTHTSMAPGARLAHA